MLHRFPRYVNFDFANNFSNVDKRSARDERLIKVENIGESKEPSTSSEAQQNGEITNSKDEIIKLELRMEARDEPPAECKRSTERRGKLCIRLKLPDSNFQEDCQQEKKLSPAEQGEEQR